MRLDETFIAIRQRNMLEICDLSLHVIRDHFWPLTTLLLINAIPWITLDWLLTSWLIRDGWAGDSWPFFYWLTAGMVISQAQVGTTMITYYLGQAMFVGRLGIRETIRETVGGATRMPVHFFWIHGLVRMVLPILLLVWLIQDNTEDTRIVIGAFWLPILVFVALLIRALRPFASEILLLEKTPRISTDPAIPNFKKRSRWLHGGASGELFGRAIIMCLFSSLLAFSFYAMLASADATLNLFSNSDFSLLPCYWLVALWLSAGFAAVVRFLSYIDLRIRQEGWSVELKMKAAGERLRASAVADGR